MKYLILSVLILVAACSAKPPKENLKNADELVTKKEVAADEADAALNEISKDKKIKEQENIMGTIDTNPLAAPTDVAAAPENATTTPSGLSFVILREGMGMGSPSPSATVTAHYTGWETNGKMFDSSVQRGQPFKAPLNRLIKGWQEGMGMMTKGEMRRFWIPADLAYGENPRAGAPAGMLVFDVELIDFEEPK